MAEFVTVDAETREIVELVFVRENGNKISARAIIAQISEAVDESFSDSKGIIARHGSFLALATQMIKMSSPVPVPTMEHSSLTMIDSIRLSTVMFFMGQFVMDTKLALKEERREITEKDLEEGTLGGDVQQGWKQAKEHGHTMEEFLDSLFEASDEEDSDDAVDNETEKLNKMFERMSKNGNTVIN